MLVRGGLLAAQLMMRIILIFGHHEFINTTVALNPRKLLGQANCNSLTSFAQRVNGRITLLDVVNSSDEEDSVTEPYFSPLIQMMSSSSW